MNTSPTLAIVYDWVSTRYGGAEQVISALSKLYPDAPIFTSVYDPDQATWANDLTIHTSFLQKIPLANRFRQFFLGLMPLAFETLDLSAFDIIISVTSGPAKGIITAPTQLHLCYLLTPPRYLYSHQQQYLHDHPVLKLPIVHQLLQLFYRYLRCFDQASILRPDSLATISQLVSDRLAVTYVLLNSSATTPTTHNTVIYPPVSLTEPSSPALPRLSPTGYYLSLSRLVGYKRVDLAIQACLLLNRSLIVAGSGNQERSLQKIAKSLAVVRPKSESLANFLQRHTNPAGRFEKVGIYFVGAVTNQEVSQLLTNCKALLLPGQEDFGISALEAGIFGKPVIVLASSGVAEVLKTGVTAVYSKGLTVKDVTMAIQELEKINFVSTTIQNNAQKYRQTYFQHQFASYVKREWKKFQQRSAL